MLHIGLTHVPIVVAIYKQSSVCPAGLCSTLSINKDY